ncbi:hypothetical protein GCM10009801_11030 [Streptomyces albiaxialis]|uniref:Uncharacterized protein n=1 Tax=Streptomyces albiaxialis TaxID=329523 RepID=A0ABP5H5U4_9ACTN
MPRGGPYGGTADCPASARVRQWCAYRSPPSPSVRTSTREVHAREGNEESGITDTKSGRSPVRWSSRPVGDAVPLAVPARFPSWGPEFTERARAPTQGGAKRIFARRPFASAPSNAPIRPSAPFAAAESDGSSGAVTESRRFRPVTRAVQRAFTRPGHLLSDCPGIPAATNFWRQRV